MKDIEKMYMDHVIHELVEAGRTVTEAKALCEAFKKYGSKAWNDAMNNWFDEIHPY